MMHRHRRYSVKPIDITTGPDLNPLAQLVDRTWSLCSAWQFRSKDPQAGLFLLLNDATSENSAQEYALCHVDAIGYDPCDGIDHQHPDTTGVHGLVQLTQWESFTLSWMRDADVLRAAITRSLAAGPFTWDAATPPERFSVLCDAYRGHHCALCA